MAQRPPASFLSRLKRPFDRQTAKGALKTTLALANTALDGCPIWGPKAAVSSLLEVVLGIEKTVRNVDTVTQLDEDVLLLYNCLLQPLSAMKHSSVSPALQNDINTLVAELDTISQQWRKHPKRNPFTRFANRDNDEEMLSDLAQEIKKALDRFELAGNIHQRQQLYKIEERQKKMHVGQQQLQDGQIEIHGGQENLREAQKELQDVQMNMRMQDLLRLLQPASQAPVNSGRVYAIEKCLEGTRHQILKDINTWVKDGTKPFYWLNGIAGVGKTTIAKSVALLAQKEGNLAGSFFFSRRAADEDVRIPEKVFPSLAYQFARFDSIVSRAIADAVERTPDAATMALHLQAEKLFVEPLQNINHLRRPLLVVIDAFDECEESRAALLLLRLLDAVPRIPMPLKVFITSRPNAHIHGVFKQSRHTEQVILHNVQLSVIQSDIRLYLTKTLRSVPTTLELELCENWFTEEELEALVGKSGRLFVYAATAGRFVADKVVRNPPRQLRILIKIEHSEGATPFVELDELYLHILGCIPLSQDRPFILKRFHSVVGATVLLRTSLPLDVMERFLDLERGSVRAALHPLNSVIITPLLDNEPPNVYHPSFAEFLLDEKRCTSDFHIKAEEQEKSLAHHCLKILTTNLRRNSADIDDCSLLNQDVPGFDDKVKIGITSEMDYACRYWGSHLGKANHGDASLVGLIEDLASRCLLWWIKACSLLGVVSSAITCTRDAGAWAHASRCSPKCVGLLDDAHRLLLAHYQPITASAPHVYRSALPFTPHQTVLYNQYRVADTSVTIVRGVAPRWASCLDDWLYEDKKVLSSTAQLRTSLSVSDALARQRPSNPSARRVDSPVSTPLLTVVISPDGTRCASGSADGTLSVWDASSGDCLTSMKGHLGSVNSVAFSLDGSRLVSGSFDHTVRVWDLVSGENTATLNDRSMSVISVAFSPDGSYVASGSSDGMISLWDVIADVIRGTVMAGSRSIRWLAFSPDGSRLMYSVSEDTGTVWSALKVDLSWTWNGYSRLCAWTSPDQAAVASRYPTTIQSHGTESRIASNKLLLRRLSLDFATCIAYSPDGTTIASGSNDNTIRMWSVETEQQIRQPLEGHTNLVTCMTYSPDGTTLASGSDDNTIRIWNVETGEQIGEPLVGHTRHVTCIAYSPDGTTLVSGSDDYTIRTWGVTREQTGPRLVGHTNSISCIAYSPDGTTLASGSNDKTIRMWDAHTGEQMGQPLNSHTARIAGITFPSDPTTPASRSIADHVVDPITYLANFPDSEWTSSRAEAGVFEPWNSVAGTPIMHSDNHPESVGSPALSSDGLYIAAGCQDHVVRVWNLTMGVCRAELKGHRSSVNCVTFSGDGTCLASASSDRSVRLWEPFSGACIKMVEAPSADVTSLQFHEASGLVAASTTGSILHWKPEGATGTTSRNSVSRCLVVGDDIVGTSVKDQWLYVDWGSGLRRTCFLPYPCNAQVMSSYLKLNPEDLVVKVSPPARSNRG